MKKYTEIYNNLPYLNIPTIKTNKKITYINLPCGFDIETTSVKQGDNKIAFMYVWQLGLGHNEPIYYGREWSELLECLEYISEYLNLSESKRLVIYVHNLGYEFQFMRKYFHWLDVFSVSERKPIKALCSLGIEFRDSYILSGFSLENTAKNLTKYKVTKKVGDLDYNLIRHSSTPLTELELGYCKNDIEIITAYIQEQIDYYGDINKIPTTNTGRVRSYVRNECYYTSTNHRKTSKSKYIRYRKIMNDLTLDADTYIMLRRAFMGGFTHANHNYVGMTLKDVTSIDFTSSYPAVMVSEKFPMSRFKDVTIESETQFKQYCQKYAMVFNIKFHGLKPKIDHEVYISESKCFSISNPVINNGRVVSADHIATTLTEIDFNIMEQVYTWDSIELSNVKYAHKNYLPKSIVKSVLDLYQDKTVLKDVVGSEVEYLLSKGMLNSIYGMCVTDIIKDNAIYTGEWFTEKVNIDEEIEKYNESKNRFLYYPWGVWVTAYARRNLWTGILAVGSDYVYSDTDSLKLLNYEKHKNYVKWFDSQIISKMTEMCKYYKFDESLLHPKTKDGTVKTLGIWDYEGTYNLFKTLGAKRYMMTTEKGVQITVAGLSKQNGVKYMLEQSGGNVEKVFEMFDNNLYIPSDKTGKMTHTYIDDEVKVKVVDYLGNEQIENPLSGIHLEPCDFTLSLSKQYLEFLNNLSKGYIYKGLTQV